MTDDLIELETLNTRLLEIGDRIGNAVASLERLATGTERMTANFSTAFDNFRDLDRLAVRSLDAAVRFNDQLVKEAAGIGVLDEAGRKLIRAALNSAAAKTGTNRFDTKTIFFGAASQDTVARTGQTITDASAFKGATGADPTLVGELLEQLVDNEELTVAQIQKFLTFLVRQGQEGRGLGINDLLPLVKERIRELRPREKITPELLRDLTALTQAVAQDGRSRAETESGLDALRRALSDDKKIAKLEAIGIEIPREGNEADRARALALQLVDKPRELVDSILDPTALGALGPALENVREKGGTVFLDKLRQLDIPGLYLAEYNAVQRETAERAFKAIDTAGQILIQNEALETTGELTDLVNDRSPGELRTEIARRVFGPELPPLPLAGAGRLVGLMRLGLSRRARGSFSTGDAINTFLSGASLVQGAGGDGDGPSRAARRFASKRLFSASTRKLVKPLFGRKSDEEPENGIDVIPGPRPFVPIPDPIRIPTASRQRRLEALFSMPIGVFPQLLIDRATPGPQSSLSSDGSDAPRQLTEIDPGVGAPIAQASILPLDLFGADPVPALPREGVATVAASSILPMIEEALGEETARAREDAEDHTALRTALVALVERSAQEINGLITIRVRVDQQGKLRVDDVVPHVHGIEFAFDIDEGPTNIISL